MRTLDDLPAQLRLRLPGRAEVLLGVHASPLADDGPGIEPAIGGHTHTVTDRVIGGIRALNPGSAGLPRISGTTHWLLLEDNGDAMTATHRSVPYDAQAVAADLHGRRHPNAEFVTSLLTGQHQMS